MLTAILALSIAQLPTAVVPGKSIGPIALGMTHADLAQTGIAVGPGRFEHERRVGVFDVTFKDGKVSAISYELGKGPMGGPTVLQIGAHKVAARSPQQIASLIGGCGPMQRNTGGNVIECSAGATVVQHMGGMGVRVGPAATAVTGPTCDGYLEPGNPASKLTIEPDKTYCLPSRTVTSALRPDDVLGKLRYNTCQKQANRGATTITCPFQGTRFVFGGPTLVLSVVTGVPLKE